jgi:hypothetical protein
MRAISRLTPLPQAAHWCRDRSNLTKIANKIREISGRRLNDGPVPQVPEILGHRQTFEPRLLTSPIQLARAAEFGRQLETSSDSLR